MGEATTGSLDSIDWDILAILQTDGRLSGAGIGRKVGLSQPAVSVRIQRLERSGVIAGYRAVVDPARVGLNIHAVVRSVRRTPGSARRSNCSRRCPRSRERTG
ncbi:Lrp/AsnC family transcriptional regulator [Kribbella karoonensis]|uniref:HTH asnC-type domain-containing protein n=1 Tax=Kribbella karoonensis TaxID=324851 RepID=A0ABN2DK17_9ACTN